MKTGTRLGLLALFVALACGGVWFRQAWQVDIPENRTAYVVVFGAAAALGIVALSKGAGRLGGAAAVVAILIGSFLPSTVAISRQEVAEGAIRVGDTLPQFTAVDEHGHLFDSATLRGRPTLIKFFRAHW